MRVRTLSMPSYSLPLFVPLGGGGGAAEPLSSLPLVEDAGLRSLPSARLRVDMGAAGFAALRCAAMSSLRFLASSRFSSVYLRRRSCGTQSSQLCGYLISTTLTLKATRPKSQMWASCDDASSKARRVEVLVKN